MAGDGFRTPMAPIPSSTYHGRFYDASCVFIHAFMEIGVCFECYVLSRCLFGPSEGGVRACLILHAVDYLEALQSIYNDH